MPRSRAYPTVAVIGELRFVQRDGERVEAKRGGAIDELEGGVRQPVDRIVGGMEVKVYFQHVTGVGDRVRVRGDRKVATSEVRTDPRSGISGSVPARRPIARIPDAACYQRGSRRPPLRHRRPRRRSRRRHRRPPPPPPP